MTEVLPRTRGCGLPAGAAARAAVVVAMVLAGLAMAGCAGGAGPLGGSSPAPTSSLSLKETARASVETLGQVRSGGLWVIKGSALLISTDGGQTWRGSSIPKAKLNTLAGWPAFVLDAEHAWSITDAHTIYRTSDGGITWTAANLPGECEMHFGISFVNAQAGYVVCLGIGTATVLHTDDGGAAWTVVNTAAATGSGPIGSNVTATDQDTLWAASNHFDNSQQALLAVSRDGGSTWWDASLPALNPVDKEPNNPVAGLPFFATAQDGVLFAADGSGNRAYRTADGGRTWSDEALFLPQLGWMVVQRLPEPVVSLDSWVAFDGESKQILHTKDAGSTWTIVKAQGLPNPANEYGVAFSDDEHGAVVLESTAYNSGSGALLVTADGGTSWTVPDLASAAPVPSPEAAGDEQTARDTAAAYAGATVAHNEAAIAQLLSPLAQLERAQPDATPRPPTGFTISTVAPAGQQLDPAFANLDLVETAAWSRAYRVTVRFTSSDGSSEDQPLLVAPLLGSGWRIWTLDSVAAGK